MTLKRRKELSQSPAAIKKREQTRTRREARDTEASGQNDGKSTASIGVDTPPAPDPAADPAAPKPQLYHCSNCDANVTEGMTECPICEINLNWPTGG